MSVLIPEGYRSILSVYDTQLAISLLHRLFEDNLSAALGLYRVSAPLFVEEMTGLNDNLNGVERPVEFDIGVTGTKAQVVQSLAKWKRMALHRYGFFPGKGIYTDMNAIRRDEEVLDNLHSVYVDQWDWEKVITEHERTLDYLKSVVIDIVRAVCETQNTLQAIFPKLIQVPRIERTISFVDTQTLEDLWPEKTPKERENLYLKDHPTAFIMRIGAPLRSGKPHDGRSPDYDDWELNGDLIVWNSVLQQAFELSSMGIRVNAESLDRQLSAAG